MLFATKNHETDKFDYEYEMDDDISEPEYEIADFSKNQMNFCDMD